MRKFIEKLTLENLYFVLYIPVFLLFLNEAGKNKQLGR
jgi:hypothetical protein